MFPSKLLLIAACLLATVCTPLQATQPPPPLADAEVISIASAHWPNGESGRARVVVLARGYEHVSSEVVAQWLEPGEEAADGWRVAAARELVAPGFNTLASLQLVPTGNAVRVELAGHHTYQPEVAIACVFELSANGEVRVLDPCGE
ncbi:hypothetical protein OK348_04845 [Flavobacterium sp. MXW15]|uniref:Uncharacterized protein n=1 Tax=Xanthomonas chitinilytica TaxID=2989819 RepID=A0ABT3JS87_9XANT|nr:hypothetical protein [Xanthomonas sp. H13-6]MCW4454114.1 hypothetical protein [Flavobacterium sp. MXW15]MCW4471348.1 hypothetical protein [Xanthomonas sp. H13-6]